MFTNAQTRKAITNNLIWVLVAPALVTAVGLVFAVLSERIKLATALKTVAVRADGDLVPGRRRHLAAGLRQQPGPRCPQRRGGRGARHVRCRRRPTRAREPATTPASPPRPAATAAPDPVSTGHRGAGAAGRRSGIVTARQRRDRRPRPTGAGLHGTVWLDFTQGGGGTSGAIDPAEKGMPGVTVQAVRDGKVVEQAEDRRQRHLRIPEADRRRLHADVAEVELRRAVQRRQLARSGLRDTRRSSSPTCGCGPASRWC